MTRVERSAPAQVGVLTNDPEYDWQLKNLNQYALYSLDRVQTSPWAASGPPKVFGHGLNTKGLPPSYSPPDRFAGHPRGGHPSSSTTRPRS